MMPAARVVVFPQAKIDLTDCTVAISRYSDGAAVRFIDAFDETVLAIARYPLADAIVESSGRQLFGSRSWPVRGFENWRIFYRLQNDRLEVVRLLHSARDLDVID